MDIDPLRPKVTVLGNVNPQILIKRLSKVGKHAELCRYEEFESERKEAGIASIMKESENHNIWRREGRQVDSCDIKIDKINEIKVGSGGKYWEDIRKENKDLKSNMTANNFSIPRDKMENLYMPHPQRDSSVQPQVDFRVHPNMPPHCNINGHPHQYCYIAQPCAVAVPYYAIPSYTVDEYYNFHRSSFQPPFLRPGERVGDYFSDENTMGCHVM